MTRVLEARGLTKRFGGLVAVDGVNLHLDAGEILGLLGPNGAGKTTLFNLLTGFIRPDDGTLQFDGHDLARLAPQRIVNLGLARTFQLARPFRQLSVIENVMVACLSPRARARNGDPDARARAVLEQVGLADQARAPVEILPYGDLRRLEIGRALATEPRAILLDEPFAGLAEAEIEPLAALIRRLNGEGLTILIIEHKLHVFMRLVGRVIALNFGAVIAEGTPAEIVRHPEVVEAYLGADADADAPA